jgi:hypothetical protein
MLLRNRNKLTASLCAAALLISSTAASAASAPQAVDPWLALSAMSSSSSASTAVSTTAAAQSDAAYDRGFSAPPWPALAVIAATLALAIYLLVDDEDDDGVPVSPA